MFFINSSNKNQSQSYSVVNKQTKKALVCILACNRFGFGMSAQPTRWIACTTLSPVAKLRCSCSDWEAEKKNLSLVEMLSF